MSHQRFNRLGILSPLSRHVYNPSKQATPQSFPCTSHSHAHTLLWAFENAGPTFCCRASLVDNLFCFRVPVSLHIVNTQTYLNILNQWLKMATKDDNPIDTKSDIEHNEKAAAEEPWVENPALDKRLNRKFDLHILPWLFGIWYRLRPSTLPRPERVADGQISGSSPSSTAATSAMPESQASPKTSTSRPEPPSTSHCSYSTSPTSSSTCRPTSPSRSSARARICHR